MAYIDQTRKARIATALKAILPAGWKYSLAIRSHMTLVLTIQSAPVDLLAKVSERDGVRVGSTSISARYLDRYLDGEALAIMERAVEAMNDGNHDRSDLQADYFDVGWYVDIYVGRWNRPFVCTAPAPAAAGYATAVAWTDDRAYGLQQSEAETMGDNLGESPDY